MRFWAGLRRVLGLPPARHQFDATPKPIDRVIYEMSARSRRVTREDALSVPAVQRGRNLICSTATLPLVQIGPKGEYVRNRLLEQLDLDVPNVVTLAQTFEDLLCDSLAWWEITAQDLAGYPIAVRHVDARRVSLHPPGGMQMPNPLPSGEDPRGAVVWIDGQPVGASRVIRFDSPNPPLLTSGARAIRRAILLDAAASMYADDPRPLDYFTPAEGADPVSDDEIEDILADWKAARKKRSTAWVPAAMKYNAVDSPSPQQLQLVELQRQASLDLANALGVDPEDLGISTTSRTYFNAIDRRQSRINDVLASYMRAITDRLSMGDVTRRGHRVAFDLRDYMKGDPETRVAYYEGMKRLGAITDEEIREMEGLPPRATPPAPPEPPIPPADDGDQDDDTTTDDPKADPAKTSGAEVWPHLAEPSRPFATFNGTGPQPMLFDVPVTGFTVDTQRRTVEGIALPYGPDQVANKHGLKFRFVRGALQWGSVSRVKLLRDHDMSQPIGKAVDLTDLAAGLRVKFRVTRGQSGDDALALAADEVLDGFSVGVDFDMATDVYMDDDGVMNVTRADLREVSLTAMPAFDDARVTKVAASRARGNPVEECATCGQRHAPGACQSTGNPPPANQGGQNNGQQNQQANQPSGLQLTDDQLRALMTNQAAMSALVGIPAQPQGQGQQAQQQGFTLSTEQINALAAGGHLRTLLGIGNPNGQQQDQGDNEPPRQVVNPTRNRYVALVREELPYRFDGKGNLTRGTQYDFSTDVIAGLRDGDREALVRAEKFVQTQFAAPVDTTDAAALNPNRQRPDLYVDQRAFTYPIWDAINKGTIADATPFTLPKFSAASGMVADHTQGNEPSSGDFTATSQTITPTAVSGKVSITREAWDQGGNPQLSGLVWNQMVRAWYEALEAAAVTLLNGLSPTDILLTTGAVDDALVSEIETALAVLQFVRGGFRMRDLFVQVDLYKALIDATGSDGRKLLPRLNPVNASGEVSDFFADVMVGGLRGRPSWALAASGSVAAKSYLFDRGDVSGWATAPNRLTFENVEVRFVHVGIWGYKALANTDVTGVRTITYDPVV